MGSKLTLTASDGHTMDAYRADPSGDVKGFNDMYKSLNLPAIILEE